MGSFAKNLYIIRDILQIHRSLLQHSPTPTGLSCKKTPHHQGSSAKEYYMTRAFLQIYRSLLQQISTQKGPFCKKALHNWGSSAKELYIIRALLQKWPAYSTVSTENATSPTSTRSRNSDSSVSCGTHSNWDHCWIWICTKESEYCDLVDLQFEFIQKNLSFWIWWISWVYYFQWNLSYRVQILMMHIHTRMVGRTQIFY